MSRLPSTMICRFLSRRLRERTAVNKVLVKGSCRVRRTNSRFRSLSLITGAGLGYIRGAGGEGAANLRGATGTLGSLVFFGTKDLVLFLRKASRVFTGSCFKLEFPKRLASMSSASCISLWGPLELLNRSTFRLFTFLIVD